MDDQFGSLAFNAVMKKFTWNQVAFAMYYTKKNISPLFAKENELHTFAYLQ